MAGWTLGGIVWLNSNGNIGDLVEMDDALSETSAIVLVIFTFLLADIVVVLLNAFFSKSFSFIVLNGEKGKTSDDIIGLVLANASNIDGFDLVFDLPNTIDFFLLNGSSFFTSVMFYFCSIKTD